jgi:hypothetical protein
VAKHHVAFGVIITFLCFRVVIDKINSSPSLDYKKDLFEGERMACASSDEEDIVENLFLDFETDEEDDEGDLTK